MMVQYTDYPRMSYPTTSVYSDVRELREEVMSRLVWLFAVVVVPIASMVHAAESFFVSCDGSPKEARLELPAPANEWGKVGCSQFGHILMAQNGWFWGQDPTPRPAFLPADLLNTMQMRKVGNNVYFKEFKLRQLTGSEALKRHELFHKWVGKERTSIYPEVWELLAVNESGRSLTLNVFKRPSGGGWGIACVPECDRMKPFVIVQTKK